MNNLSTPVPDYNRTILHMDLDSFFVSVERIKDPSLNGKPVIIGAVDKRGVVTSASYEARKFGVHSAMPGFEAHRLCPHGIYLRGNMEDYSRFSKIVTAIIKEEAPLFEKSSIDEFYIDLTGMDRFFGSYKWATKLRHRIMKETGLPISFGLSSSKMVAKVATGEAKPNGQLMVPKGEERSFLANMPVGKIPFIGKAACEKMTRLNIVTVNDLANTHPDILTQHFGKVGPTLWRKAHGVDHSPIVPYFDAKSVSVERTFHQNSTDVQYMKSLLAAMVERLAYQIREDQKVAACVTVKIKYSDFSVHSHQCMIPHTSADHIFLRHLHQLFDEAYEKGRPVRLLGARLSHLEQGFRQINLFDDTFEMISLYQALDTIKRRHGMGMITKAAGWGTMSQRREVNPFARD